MVWLRVKNEDCALVGRVTGGSIASKLRRTGLKCRSSRLGRFKSSVMVYSDNRAQVLEILSERELTRVLPENSYK